MTNASSAVDETLAPAAAGGWLTSLRGRLVLATAITVSVTAGVAWLAFQAAGGPHPVFGGAMALVVVVALIAIFDLVALSLVHRPIQSMRDELQRRNEQLVESYQRMFALREQLASAEQLASVGQTAANVAHQVGTPLNLISGYVQLLKEDVGPASPLVPRIAIIEEQIGKVTATVRTLLDRSRLTGRKTQTRTGALIERVVEVLRPRLDAARIAVQIDTPAGDAPILADLTNLELALLNLMTNAIDAMGEGGTLGIRVTQTAPDRVRVDITDTGPGVPEGLLPRIFEPWVSTKAPGRGTGLGLPIARDVVAAHGGSISVSSASGHGTTFTIELPVAAGRDPHLRPS